MPQTYLDAFSKYPQRTNIRNPHQTFMFFYKATNLRQGLPATPEPELHSHQHRRPAGATVVDVGISALLQEAASLGAVIATGESMYLWWCHL